MFGSRFCMGRVNAMGQSKGDNRELYLGTLLMVGAMFLWAVKEPQRARESWLTRLAKYDAQTFYLMHLWVIEALGMIIVRAGLNLPIPRG